MKRLLFALCIAGLGAAAGVCESSPDYAGLAAVNQSQANVNQAQANAALAQAQAAQANSAAEYAAVLQAAVEGQTAVAMQALNYQFAATMMPYVVMTLVILGLLIGGPLLLWVLLANLNARYQHEKTRYWYLYQAPTTARLGAPAPTYLEETHQARTPARSVDRDRG
ncbi:MAG: hypothetical protein KKA73_18035 [Chloroflexi bacterium]|nr:hypothetical protein [Chloroflexota bacterium]